MSIGQEARAFETYLENLLRAAGLCHKCFGFEKTKELFGVYRQVFSIDNPKLGGFYSWDVNKAMDLVAATTHELFELPPHIQVQLAKENLEGDTIERCHLDHVNADEPGLAIIRDFPSQPRTLIVIDGSHRLVRACLESKLYKVYLLSEEEEVQCRWTQDG